MVPVIESLKDNNSPTPPWNDNTSVLSILAVICFVPSGLKNPKGDAVVTKLSL